jgi:Heterokaryon incompatibility protein (HET)
MILINGRQFEVRKNLWDFLNHARKFSPSRVFWIDAICIDQNNIPEKNQQVQRMGCIYRQADEVLVWLGSATKELAHLMQRITEYVGMGSDEMLAVSAEDDMFWDGFRQIQESAYWNRVWTVQEFLLPRCGRLVAGEHSVRIKDFATLLGYTQHSRKGQDGHAIASHDVQGNLAIRALNNWLHPLEHHTVNRDKWWQLTRNRHCYDIRDRIYATLSLKEGHGLRMDYAVNPFELFLETLWLGQNHHFERGKAPVIRADVAQGLANMLEITPASVLLYVRRHRQVNGPSLTPDPYLAWRAKQQLHLRAAASDIDRSRWLTGLKVLPGSDSFQPHDHWCSAYPLSQPLEDKYGMTIFPQRLPRPLDLESTPDPRVNHLGYRLLLSTVYEQRSRRPDDPFGDLGEDPIYDLEDWDFLNRKCSWCLVSGIYHTKCAEVPRRVYYMLVDQTRPE